jgi:probable F420-dependent oxidoreductase
VKFSFSLPRPEIAPSPTAADDYVHLARSVESLGLHAVSASDHPFPFEAPGQAGHQAHDPFVLLSHIAAATKTLQLHFSLIVVPYRNPFLVARSLSTLDLVSRGRVIAGLGAGYLRPEFDALGADFGSRAETLDEAVTAMNAAWTGEPLNMEGTGWRAAGNRMRPVPLTRPHPPLWRGGNNETAIDHAARSFDGWSPFEVAGASSEMTATRATTIDTLPTRLATLRRALEHYERHSPFDVCFVRSARRWQLDDNRAIDEMALLADMGVTWLEFTVAGSSVAETTDNIARFAELAKRANVVTA